jgi:hypothetical protein
MTSMKRWRGLTALVHGAVKHGSLAVEDVQKQTARVAFSVLESIEPVARPARAVHVAHDLYVSGVHGAVRIIGAAVAQTVDVALQQVEQRTGGDKQG